MKKTLYSIFFLTFFSFAFSGFVNAQNVYKVYLDKEGETYKDTKLKLNIPVFKYKGNTIEEYDKFGVRLKEKPATHTVIYPALKGVEDTAFGYIFYNTGIENQSAYTAFLIANTKRRVLPALIYIDRNKNYDFSDDGAPDTFPTFQPDITLTISKKDDPEYKIRIKRFNFFDMTFYKKMLNEYYEKYQDEKKYVGAEYAFLEKRLHTKKTTIIAEGDTFQIALRDENYNGKYTDDGDKILLMSQKDTLFDDETYIELNKKNKEIIFEWNFKVYQVLNIETNGNSIEFQLMPNRNADKQLKIGKKIPKFTYYKPDGKTKMKIKKFRRKPLYLYFFNSQDSVFQMDSVYLNKIQNYYGDEMYIVCLAYKDIYRNIQVMEEYEQPKWHIGMVTSDVIREYFVQEIPRGFYCKKRRRLLDNNITPKELWEKLKKEHGD